MKKGKLWCSLFLAIAVLCACITPAFAAQEDRPALKFGKDGTFKVLLIADPQDTSNPSNDMVDFITAALAKEKPDFVVFLGDNLAGYWYGIQFGREKKVRKAIDAIIKPVNDAKVPFALVFGNHDVQTEISKEDQMKIYQEYPYCLAIDEGSDITGCGTYNIPVKNSDESRDAFNFWFFDINNSKYVIDDTQLDWYRRTSDALKEANDGQPVPSLAFQHVMVPEAYQTLTEVSEGAENAVPGTGVYSGKYYVANSDYAVRSAIQGTALRQNVDVLKSEGQFDTFRQQGDVCGLYVGHDHKNEYTATLEGIDLGFVPTCGFHMFGPGDDRAMRVIELSENAPADYTSYILYFRDAMGREPKSTFHDTALSDFWRTYNTWIVIGAVVLVIGAPVVVVAAKKIKRKKQTQA